MAEPEWAFQSADIEMLGILDRHGCTISEDSVQAVIDAGYSRDQLIGMGELALTSNQATAQGEYVVFGSDVCTINIPAIESRWSVSDPDILSMAPFVREEYEFSGEVIVDEGCFFEDPLNAFALLNGGDLDAGFQDYVSLLSIGIITGDLRLYSPSPLRTPVSFQLLTGDCANVANYDDIIRSQSTISDGFDEWVRASDEYNVCAVDSFTWPPGLDARLQGYNPEVEFEDQPSVNAFMGPEWMIITLAAGWHEGASGTQRGQPRPPMCHYPPQ